MPVEVENFDKKFLHQMKLLNLDETFWFFNPKYKDSQQHSYKNKSELQFKIFLNSNKNLQEP
jgi:hypothetical protein